MATSRQIAIADHTYTQPPDVDKQLSIKGAPKKWTGAELLHTKAKLKKLLEGDDDLLQTVLEMLHLNRNFEDGETYSLRSDLPGRHKGHPVPKK